MASLRDQGKIKYVGNYFIGKAWSWFEPIMREKNSRPKEDWSDRTGRVLSSFDGMKKAMRQVFGEIDERTVAAQRLQHLRQNRSVREYITEFQTISSNLEWDEDALMDKFKGGFVMPAMPKAKYEAACVHVIAWHYPAS
jgi:hypothetical protein